MNNLVWSPNMELGIPEVDKAHRCFLQKLSDIIHQPELNFESRYLSLVSDLEQDFKEEEGIMESIQFYEILPHREQHAKVLEVLHAAIPDVKYGINGSALHVLESLPKWFLFHLKSMDALFATWFNLQNSSLALESYLINAPQIPGGVNSGTFSSGHAHYFS